MDDTKVLPLALTQEQRKRLGVLAAEKCVAMTELVRWWIDEKWGGRDKPVAVVAEQPSVRSLEVKKVEVASGWSEPAVAKEKPRKAHAIGAVSEEAEAPSHVCAICRVKHPESEMQYHAKTMKWACNDCVENQKNNQ